MDYSEEMLQDSRRQAVKDSLDTDENFLSTCLVHLQERERKNGEQFQKTNAQIDGIKEDIKGLVEVMGKILQAIGLQGVGQSQPKTNPKPTNTQPSEEKTEERQIKRTKHEQTPQRQQTV